MGQAKQRGTFEQRQAAAYEAVDANIEVRKRELEQLDEFEKRQLDAMGRFLNTTVMPSIERRIGAPIRIDFSQIPMGALNGTLKAN